MGEKRVEDVADGVDEFVNVIIEAAIVGGDNGQFGVGIQKDESSKMDNRELVQSDVDRVLVRGQTLEVLQQAVELQEVRFGFNFHDQSQGALYWIGWGSCNGVAHVFEVFSDCFLWANLLGALPSDLIFAVLRKLSYGQSEFASITRWD